MTSLRVIGVTLIALAGFLTPACDGSPPTDNSGSETHWLKICDSNAPCGTLQCICGTCTLPCSAESECRSLGTRATCASATASGAACMDSPAPAASLCLSACSAQADCSIGSSCRGGACIPNLAPPADAGSGGSAGDASSGGAPTGGGTGTGGTSGSGGSTGGTGTDGASGSGGSTGGTGTGGASGSGGSTGGRADASAGAGGRDASGPDGGTSDGTAVATYNEPCSGVGIGNGACLGHAQTRQLVCDGTKWVANGSCITGTLCDTTPGTRAGSCQPIVPECTGATPGSIVCKGSDRVSCGVDLVTTAQVATCTNQICSGGTCTGVCAPPATQCSGNRVQTCNASGQWGTPVPCINQACVGGACTGICTPTAAQCSGNGVQTCTSQGIWGVVTPCTSQACLNGACSGTCAPLDTQCSGNGVQTCNAQGQWGTVAPCSNKTCVGGACIGVCEPGTRCNGNSVETCNASGQWSNPTACTNQACASGACTGACAPAATRCTGNSVETCNTSGLWANAVPCTNKACSGGACIGVCEPGTTRCLGNDTQTCGATGQWSTSASCSAPQVCILGACVTGPPSCAGLPADCGPTSNENCCASPLVAGGTFFRGYDAVTNTDQSSPATVSSFRLDRFETTVGRFRKFLSSWTSGWRPTPGAGKHSHLNGGQGLVTTTGGYEPGWNATWEASIPKTIPDWNARLECHAQYQTWTPGPGGNEHKPVNCLTWYERYAFCIWDGGFLPSEAEWNYAASGGSEQRVYPWSVGPTSTTIDGSYAVYCGSSCGGPVDVGSRSPKGDGKYGQADLAGNLWEFALDTHSMAYVTPCNNCVQLGAPPPQPPPWGCDPDCRVARGENFESTHVELVTSFRSSTIPQAPLWNSTARCARAP